jgi:hypothetical protein
MYTSWCCCCCCLHPRWLQETALCCCAAQKGLLVIPALVLSNVLQLPRTSLWNQYIHTRPEIRLWVNFSVYIYWFCLFRILQWMYCIPFREEEKTWQLSTLFPGVSLRLSAAKKTLYPTKKNTSLYLVVVNGNSDRLGRMKRQVWEMMKSVKGGGRG